MENLINLKIHKTGSKPVQKYRFAISVKDSAKYFETRGFPVVIVFQKRILFCKTTCGQWKYNPIDQSLKFTKGFDLYSIEINSLINGQGWSLETKITTTIELRENYILLIINN